MGPNAFRVAVGMARQAKIIAQLSGFRLTFGARRAKVALTMGQGLWESMGLPKVEHSDDRANFDVDEDVSKLTGKEFSSRVIHSRAYRASILRRLCTDTLAPAVECRLLDHALGKPAERLEVEDKTIRLDQYTVEQLEERAMLLATLARRIRMNDGVPRLVPEPDDSGPPAVH